MITNVLLDIIQPKNRKIQIVKIELQQKESRKRQKSYKHYTLFQFPRLEAHEKP